MDDSNNENQPAQRWTSGLYTEPRIVFVFRDDEFDHILRSVDGWPYDKRDLFLTEKEAISAARKLSIAEIDRQQKRVNALDERYDAIEDAEMAQANG